MANVSPPRSVSPLFPRTPLPRCVHTVRLKPTEIISGCNYLSLRWNEEVSLPRKGKKKKSAVLISSARFRLRLERQLYIRSILSPQLLSRSLLTRKWRRKIHSSFKFDRASHAPHWLVARRTPRRWLDAENALSNDRAAHRSVQRRQFNSLDSSC